MRSITLTAGGKRSKVSKEEATNFVKQWQNAAQGNQVIALNISCRSWPLESFKIIQPFLESIAASIKYLNAADIMANLMTDEGLALVESFVSTFANSPLVDVDLSDNALGLRGMERIKSFLTGKSLRRLYMSNCGFSLESMDILLEIVTANDNQVAKSLKELVLDRNMMGGDGATVVGKILSFCNIERFSYQGCRIQSTEGTQNLFQGLQKGVQAATLSALTAVDVDDAVYGDVDGESSYAPLFNAIKLSPKLQHLNLSDSGMENEGLEQLTEALKASGASLTFLGLDGAGALEEEGGELLGDFFETQATYLQVLKCNYNELGDSGLSNLLIPFSATKCSLKELHLECNDFEGESEDLLVRTNFPCMQLLNLADNDDLRKKFLKQKYGSVVTFGAEEDDDEDEDDGDDGLEDLIQGFQGAKIGA